MEKTKKPAGKGNGLTSAVLVLLLAGSLFTKVYVLKSGSMAPQYPTGSVIVTTSLLGPEEGAVCAYRHNGITVIHRVVGMEGGGYIFKGDANNVADPCIVMKEEIEGRMLFALPFLL